MNALIFLIIKPQGIIIKCCSKFTDFCHFLKNLHIEGFFKFAYWSVFLNLYIEYLINDTLKREFNFWFLRFFIELVCRFVLSDWWCWPSGYWTQDHRVLQPCHKRMVPIKWHAYASQSCCPCYYRWIHLCGWR